MVVPLVLGLGGVALAGNPTNPPPALPVRPGRPHVEFACQLRRFRPRRSKLSAFTFPETSPPV